MSTITTATEVTSGGGGGGGGAPDNATYLTATSNATLSAEVVVGTSPGGELGNTWASPTVDATHSGSTHAATQAAAEATAASALAAHEADTTSIHGIADTSALYAAGGTDVAVADGGTGASTASGARTNLGLVIATDVEAHDPDLTTIAGLTPTNDDVLQRKAGAWANRTIAQLSSDLGLAAGYQPLDSDLTAIAALTTTSYGRAFLALADAAAGRTALGLGTAAVAASSDFDATGAAAAAQAASQPLDSDLTAIAALTTTSFGRSVLAAANAAALATLAGVGSGDSPQVTALNVGHATDTTITRTGAGDVAVEGNALYRAGGTDVPVTDGGTGASDASGARTNLGLAIGTNVQAYDAELAALAGLTSAADKLPYFTGSGAAAVADFSSAGRALVDDADAAAQRTTLGLGSLAAASSLAHSATTGQTANDHHAQSHDHSAAGDGTALAPATLTLPPRVSDPTTDGEIVWFVAAEVLQVGKGGGPAYFFPVDNGTGGAITYGGAASAGSANGTPRSDHIHAGPYAWLLDPGTSPTIPTGGYVEQRQELQLSGSERLTLAGSGRMVLYDPVAEWLVGMPVRPTAPFAVPDGYLHDVANRLTLASNVRGTLRGDARVMVADVVGSGGRLVLAGRGS